MGWFPGIPWNSNNHQLICGLGLGQPIPIILTPLRRDCSRVSWPALKTKNTQAITGSWEVGSSVRRWVIGIPWEASRLSQIDHVFGIYMGSSSNSSKPMSLILRNHVRSPSTWTFQRRYPYHPIPTWIRPARNPTPLTSVDPSASASSFVAWTIGTS